MPRLFEPAGSGRTYTPEQHEASLKRLAESWGMTPSGAGYTIAAHNLYQASALRKVFGDEDETAALKSIDQLMTNLERLVDHLA